MKFEDIKKLHQKKFREELGFFIVEGEHLVQELQKAARHDARLRTSEIYLTRDFAHWSSPLPMHVVQSKQMAQISETRSPQGIAAVVPLLTTPASEPRRAIYLHEVLAFHDEESQLLAEFLLLQLLDVFEFQASSLATASATLMPSTPADRIPPAYPAPSPQG